MLLWGLGTNVVGELATGDDQRRDKVQPQRVPDFDGIELGKQRVLAFGPGGLWSWGNEWEGRLALSNRNGQEAHKPIPNPDFEGMNVVAAASGDRYGYAQLRQGANSAWFWWGAGRDDWNSDHWLPNTGDTLAASVFEAATELDLVSIAADDISIGCSSDGGLYTWRPGAGGPQGHDETDYSLWDRPRWTGMRRVEGDDFGAIIQVDTLDTLAAALDSNGNVFMWIIEEFWARANSDRHSSFKVMASHDRKYQQLTSSPRQVFSDSNSPFKYIKIAADGILYGVNSDGELWAAGLNRLNEIPGLPKDEWTYGHRINGLPAVVQAVGKRGHGFALDTNGEVWNWGTGLEDGVMLTGPEFEPTIMPEMRDIRQIASISANFLALGSE